MATADARRQWPALFAPEGLAVGDGSVRASAWLDSPDQLVRGVALLFPTRDALDRFTKGWPEPVDLRIRGVARVWMNAARGVRALQDDGAVYAGEAYTEGPSERRLLIERYLSQDRFLNAGHTDWGFESGEPILGATREDLAKRFGAALVANARAGTESLVLVPMGADPGPTWVSLRFVNGHLRQYAFGLALQGPAADAVFASKWGEPVNAGYPPVYRAGNVEISREVTGVIVRDATLCHQESYQERTEAEDSVPTRWAALKNAASNTAHEARVFSVEPFGLVRERVEHGGTCDLAYWQVGRQKRDCEAESFDAVTVATTCCDGTCPATAATSTVRFWAAVAVRDLEVIRSFVPEKGRLAIREEKCDPELGCSRRVIGVSRRTPLAQVVQALARYSSFDTGLACFAKDPALGPAPKLDDLRWNDAWPDGITAICEAGGSANQTSYYWSGDATHATLVGIESRRH